jgi:putative hydrolase of the HAD superfamily
MTARDLPEDGDFSVFADVRDWVFDLDDTLYPRSCGIFEAVAVRIRAYAARVLGVSADEAFAVQKAYAARYGTTLRGLMVEHGVDPEDFLADVHAIDRTALQPDPRLAAALARLPGRKVILTSGTHDHVAATLERIGIAGHFSGVFDIVDADYLPKPAAATYERCFRRFAVTPACAAMFEDIPRNLIVPRALGMRTVLVGDHFADDVAADFVTDDLAGFLGHAADAAHR